MSLRETIKWTLFPGLNLHARLRGQTIPKYFETSSPARQRQVLDAGCGNGMLAWHSWKKGNRVIGISIKGGEVERCRRLFNQYHRIPEEELKFQLWNIYDIDKLNQPYDEIICTEVLEHLSKDREVIESFHRNLKSGGTLHLCCPNAGHPDNRESHLDHDEKGGHFRAGYTIETFKALLEPAGFSIIEQVGLGGPIRQAFNKRIIRWEEKMGFWAAFVLFLCALPFLGMDSRNPSVPYSIYVRAIKKK